MSPRGLAAGLVLLAAVGAAASAPPDHEQACRANNRGVALLEQFQPEQAVPQFRDALTADAGLSLARVNLALALLLSGDLAGAGKEAGAAAAAQPDSPRAWHVLGLARRAQDQGAEAQAAFRRVLELDPGDVAARVFLAQLLLADAQAGPAAELLRAAVEREPWNATAVYALGQARLRLGQREEGQSLLARFQELREAPAALTYGQAYGQQGRYSEAAVTTGAEPGRVDPATSPLRYVAHPLGSLPVPRLAGGATASFALALFDQDGDGRRDVFALSAAGRRLFRSSPAGFGEATAAAGLLPDQGGLAAAAGDVDKDGRDDLALLGAGDLTLFLNRPGGRLERRSLGLLATAEWPRGALLFLDADHDGDLDLLAAGPGLLLRNAGDGFARGSGAEATLAPLLAGAAALAASDFDNRRDVDVLVAAPRGPLRLLLNRRDGGFADGLPADLAATGAACAAPADFNQDGFTDAWLCGEPADRLLLSDGRGGFTLQDAPPGTGGSQQALALDYDADGLTDVLLAGPRGLRLLRNLGARWADVTGAALPEGADRPAAALAAADLDQDGDLDLVVLRPKGEVEWLESAGGTGRTLRVELRGKASNSGGVGARVEMRAGSLWQRLEVHASGPAGAPADLVFGLGPRAGADAVRVLWPSGILQAEIAPEGGVLPARLAIEELDRKPSSCPYLYAWDGRAFGFVTDFLGGGEMGYWHGPGEWNTPDPDEYVRLTDEQLAARGGRYELRVTNELEEALFLDRFELLAVDHPAGVELHPNEGLVASPPAHRLLELSELAPLRARDEQGRDLTAAVARLDRRFADGFGLLPVRGYAQPHALVLDLEGRPADGTALLLTGWTDYAFSSDNVAARQAGLEAAVPQVEAEDQQGRWHALGEAGFPVGRPQAVVFDFTGRWDGPLHRVRLATSLRVYWDQVQVGRVNGSARAATRLPLERAELRERGFSAEVSPDGREPFGYDYARVSAREPWKRFPGRYTRPGDVRELVAGRDDAFVISRPGDELALSFDAAGLPPLPRGWRRTFLLHADGYSKEMDVNSATPGELGPLPFHGMSRYPYAAPEAFPWTDELRELFERYQTRVVRDPLPPLLLTAGR